MSTYDKDKAQRQIQTDNEKFNQGVVIGDSHPLREHYFTMYRSHFERHQLDLEVLEHFGYAPMASLYGADDRPHHGGTIAQHLKMIIEEDSVTSPEVAMAYGALFKGVNRSLPMPILLAPADKVWSGSGFDTSATAAFPMYRIEKGQAVTFNPNNLKKHLGYPDADAKNLFRNFEGYRHQYKLVFLKSKKPPQDRNNLLCLHPHVAEGLKISMWRTPRDKIIVGAGGLTDIENELPLLIEATDTELPITSLAVWKDIAQKRYERVNQEISWADLSLANQHRHIVNTIRHNSNAGYSDLWGAINDPAKRAEIHDLAFDRIMRKIAKEFPALRNECQRQMLKLDEKRSYDRW